MKLFATILFLISFPFFALAQQVDIPLTISDNGGHSETLNFGLDPAATNGFDASLGELVRPPLPPPGVFDARLNIGTDGTLKDYRTGNSVYVGTYIHEIQYQLGDGGSTITLSWNLPEGITGNLNDLITGTFINVPMSGSGSYTVTNPGGINKLNMTINYDLLPDPPAIPILLSPADGAVNVSLTPTLSWNTAANAATYNIQVATDAGFGSVVVEESGISGTSYDAGLLSAETVYYWRVRSVNAAGSSDWSSHWSFSTVPGAPAVPVLLSPANGAADVEINPTLSWEAVTGADSYFLQVSTDPAFGSSTVFQTGITGTSYNVTGLSNSTIYYWRAGSENAGGTSDWSAAWNFTTVPAPPAVPTLSSPLNNSVNTAIDLTLSWITAGGADSYNLQVSTDQAFGTTVINQANITAVNYDVTALNNDTKYYWRVEAVNAGGSSGWSDIWNFTTIVAAPGVVTLLSPANNSVDISLNPTLSWNSIDGAETYDLQVSTDQTFATAFLDQTGITFTSFDVTGLGTNTKYYWRVRAVNAGGTNEWSTIWNFTTVPPPPAVPVLALPANGAACVSLNSALSWNAAAGAATYELQVSSAADFGTTVISETGLPGITYNLAQLDNGIQYYWHVRAVNSGGTSVWSEVWSFTTALAAPGLLLPLDEAPNISLTPELTWNSVTGAAAYELQVSIQQDFSSALINENNLNNPGYIIGADILLNSTTYYWRVRALSTACNSSWSEIRSFTTIPLPPAVPELLSPVNDAVDIGITPTLSWNASAGASTYDLQVSTDQTFTGTPAINAVGINSLSYNAAGLSNSTQYYWRVRAVNAGGSSDWSSVWNFTTVIVAPGTVTLLTPGNNAIDVSLDPTLSWRHVAGAATYDIQVSNVSDFATTLVDQASVTDTNYNISGLSRGTKYYWRVRAVNPGGASDWSIAWNFTTIPVAPGTPTLQFPANNSVDIATSPSLGWNAITGAATYDIQVSLDEDFTSNYASQTGVTASSFTLSGLDRETKYYWRVRAVNAGGISDWSAVWNFITIPHAPDVPALISPANSAAEIPINTTLTWSAAAGADSYDLQVSTDQSFTTLIAEQRELINLNFNLTGLSNFTTYYWRIRASNIGGTSAWSGAWSFTTVDFVAAPSGLIADAPEVGNILLSWSDNSDNETGFEVERKLTGEDEFALLNTINEAGALNYTDNTVENNTSYTYRVKAFNSNIESGYSNEISILTPVPADTLPQNFSAAPDTAGNMILTWQYETEEEDSIIIERLVEGNEPPGNIGQKEKPGTAADLSNQGFAVTEYYVPIDTVPASTTSYIDNNVSEGSSYKYRLKVLTTEGVTVAVEDTNSTPVIPLIAPSGLTGLVDENVIYLSWTDNSTQETNYVIERKDDLEFLEIAVLDANTTNFIDSGLEYYKSYVYRVYARKDVSKSAFSYEITVITTPVELIAFSASFENNKIKLNWNTASETNNKGFEVERKYNSENGEQKVEMVWQKVGFIEGKGTTTNASSYLFIDNLAGISSRTKDISYRLKQIDYDGSFEYSDVISVEVNLMPVKFLLLQNYPNPFNPSTIIKFELPEDTHVTLTIYNLLGDKIITLLNAPKPAGIYEIEFNASGLANGVYFYELSAKSFREVKKLILLK